MTDFADTYQRSLAPFTRIEPGEWTDETASGRPVIRCVDCGGLTEIDGDHRVIEGDLVVPAVNCATATCGRYQYVRLKDFTEVLR